MDKLYEIGKVSLNWLGQMGFLIETDNIRLCIDYFASPDDLRQTPVPIPTGELKDVDVFLGTHDHLDHIDHEAWKIWAKTNPDAKFVFPAAHEFLDQDPITGFYPYLQYIIETGDVKIHHAGDTVRYEGMMPKIQSYGGIDVQILPINGRDAKRYRQNCIGNMTYQEAADLAGEINPGIVIPGHWDMFADNSGDPDSFADYLDAKYGGRIKCIIPKVMEEITIQK